MKYYSCETCKKSLVNTGTLCSEANCFDGRYYEPVKQLSKSALDTQEGGDHYKGYEIEPVEFIIKNKIPGAEASIIRYACRHENKNGVEDLKKIVHYAKLIAEIHYGVKI